MAISMLNSYLGRTLTKDMLFITPNIYNCAVVFHFASYQTCKVEPTDIINQIYHLLCNDFLARFLPSAFYTYHN